MKNPIAITKTSYNKILKIDDVMAKLDQLLTRQAQLEQQLTQQLTQLSDQCAALQAQITSQSQTLQQALQSLGKVDSLRFFTQYQKPHETPLDARKRFFRSFPQAYGPLRTFQLGNVKLLKALLTICRRHHLPYFAQSGTLLGAVRHGGFIPWDDDTDLGMLRPDITFLRRIIADDPDYRQNYRVALVYDFYVKCRQIRFRTTDPDNPCFIDIMIYDYARDFSDQAWQKWHTQKATICQQLESDDPELTAAWRAQPYVDDTTPLGRKLRALYRKYYDPLIDTTVDADHATTVAWGIDNLAVDRKQLFPKSVIFPTTTLTFEGLSLAAPGDYSAYLQQVYGDIYQLPDDLITHFQHIDHTNINTAAIEKFLNAK